MSVNFYTDNSFGQYPQLQKDIQDVKGGVKSVETLDKNIGKSIVESVPMFRRIASLPEKLESDDFIPAVGLASLAVINLPEDIKDFGEACDHAKGALTHHPYQAKYNHKVAQHDFSFLRGTLVEKWMDNTDLRFFQLLISLGVVPDDQFLWELEDKEILNHLKLRREQLIRKKLQWMK